MGSAPTDAIAHVGARLTPEVVSRSMFALLALLTLLTFRDYGVSWDEQVQNIYGRMLLSYYASGFRDQALFHYLNLRYYGGAFDLVAAIANTVSPFGEYETRHLLGGIVGLVGFLGMWRLARLLAGERAALYVLVLAALTPLLYGHDFINPKDAPFAWTIVWTVYYVCRAIDELPKPRRLTAVGLGVSLGLALGTRVGGVVALVYCAPAALAFLIGRRATGVGLRAALGEINVFLVALLPALPIVLVLMALSWPWVVQAPENFAIALELFSHFGWIGKVLFDGGLYESTKLPALYLPQILLLQLPEVVLLGLVAAIAFGVPAFARRGLKALADHKSLGYVVVITAAVLPVVYFMIARPAVYNGIRHFLFVVPPTVLLAGIGLDRTHAWLATQAAWRRRGFASAFVVLVGAQLVQMVDLHPDEYVYFNVLAGGVRGAAGRYDLDYWGLSLADGARDLHQWVISDKSDPPDRVHWVYVCGDWLSAAYYFGPDGRLRYTGAQQNADFVLAIRSPDCVYTVQGKTIFEVKRGGVVLSYATDRRGVGR